MLGSAVGSTVAQEWMPTPTGEGLRYIYSQEALSDQLSAVGCAAVEVVSEDLGRAILHDTPRRARIVCCPAHRHQRQSQALLTNIRVLKFWHPLDMYGRCCRAPKAGNHLSSPRPLKATTSDWSSGPQSRLCNSFPSQQFVRRRNPCGAFYF